ncbi:MAG: response regulator [Candidatus Zixiibacteriota bacterium]
MAKNGPLVLLVEDNEDDVMLITRALKKTSLPGRLEVIRTGAEAVAYVAGASPYDDRDHHPLPELVILDLRMPGVDGYEVLKVIRSQEDLLEVPVVILTGVGEAASVDRTFDLGATVYFVKPHAGRSFADIAGEIENFWTASREREAY